MGSSSSSCRTPEISNHDVHERFQFRFTDCSCQCNASKRRGGDADLPQAAILTALMAKINRSQYDIRELGEMIQEYS